jgi:transposase
MDKALLEGLPAPIIEYINKLEARIENLTELLVVMQKEKYGTSSEKSRYVLYDGYEQENLFNEAEVYAANYPGETDTIEIKSHNRKQKRSKEELAKDLPVEKVVIEIPEEDRICDICESPIEAIGEELVRRELGMVPPQAYVTETYQVSYSCGQCLKETDEANILKAEVPAPVIKRGLASPSSVAYVIYQKYVNAMPLYRQEKDWKRWGINIPRGTMANWVIYTSEHWLWPLWLTLKGQLLLSPVIVVDESVLQVLKEPGKTPQSESRMWVYCTGKVASPSPIVLFEYQPDRAGSRPKAFLEGAENFYLLTDGYAGYNAVENAIHCGCFAHLRRKFEEAMPKKAPKDNGARIGFEYCQKLFMLERQFENLTAEERKDKRLIHSKPVLDEFYTWLETLNPLAGSKLGKAVTYALNQKKPLHAFLLDGQIEISTNRVENQIRPFVVGRKNYLFAATVDGAKASAIAYSILQTAIANNLNPYLYLDYLFTELPTLLTKNPEADLSPYLPWAEIPQQKCKNSSAIKKPLEEMG